jgi:voltage-gated potassium channel
MTATTSGEERRTRWERTMDWPLSIAALVFLAAFAIPILYPDIPESAKELARWVEWATWGLFALDYVVRLLLTRDRWPWVRRHLLDLLVVILPVLRPFRLLRLLTMLTTVHRYAGSTLRGRVGIYLFGGSGLIIFVGALAMLDRERADPEANIKTFGDSMWWAVTTVTTVGYGDRYPVTAIGRWIAVLMMLSGIALIGTVTATLATWLIDQIREERVETAD